MNARHSRRFFPRLQRVSPRSPASPASAGFTGATAMRAARAAIVAIVALALLVFGAAPLVLVASGRRLAAQDIHLSGLGGETLDDSELAHGTTIIVAWASWSPRSRDLVVRVKPLASRWSGRARVLTLDFEEDRPAVVAFLAGKDLGCAVFLDSDGQFSKKYAIATLPGLLVVKDGKVVYRGKLPDDPDPVITQALH